MAPIKIKSGHYVTTAFPSILDDPQYSTSWRQSIWVRTDKGKEILSKHFKDMLYTGRGGLSVSGVSQKQLQIYGR